MEPNQNLENIWDSKHSLRPKDVSYEYLPYEVPLNSQSLHHLLVLILVLLKWRYGYSSIGWFRKRAFGLDTHQPDPCLSNFHLQTSHLLEEFLIL